MWGRRGVHSLHAPPHPARLHTAHHGRPGPMADPAIEHLCQPPRHPLPRKRHSLGLRHRRHHPPHHRHGPALATLRHSTRRRAPRLPRHPGLRRPDRHRHVLGQRRPLPPLQNHRRLPNLETRLHQPRPRRFLGRHPVHLQSPRLLARRPRDQARGTVGARISRRDL